MDSQRPLKRISCSRCQSKKIRCNRVDPQCDNCATAGVECIYLPRKHRAKRQRGVDDKDVLFDMLGRLERLEEHCKLTQNEDDTRATRPMSVSSVDSGITAPGSTNPVPFSHGNPSSPAAQEEPHTTLDRIKDPTTRAHLFSNVFCHLRNAESRFFANDSCLKAMETAIKEIKYLENTQRAELEAHPVVTKEMARKWIQTYYGSYQFDGFKLPLEESFLMSIPDLLEIPHVQLDHASQIIYYNVLLHGILMDSDQYRTKGAIIAHIYHTCMGLTVGWLSQIKHTPADLYVAFVMVSMSLEGCNVELSWQALGHACTIAKALGYFSVDEDPEEPNAQKSMVEGLTENDTEMEKNRKRFEFWYLLRTDCLFRLSFGKPALIRPGTWRVNFPNPTINNVDDESTRFIQIHFLASMRLTLVLLKYLGLADSVSDPDPAAYDKTVDSLISEVQSIISGWNAEELLSSTTNHVDAWFCMDILLSSYKMLISFDQSKNCNQNSDRLPPHTVEIARKSLHMFQLLMRSTFYAHWGLSLILLYQSIPLFILCLDIIESRERPGIDADLALVTWVSDFVERTAEERVELRPAMAVMRAISLVCQKLTPSGH